MSVARTHTDRRSARHSRLFHAGGLRTIKVYHNVRRRAMSQNEDFVTEMNVPKMQQAGPDGGAARARERPRGAEGTLPHRWGA